MHDTQMYIPEEPIYNLDDDISPEDNEKQDIATIISKIYIPFMVFARYELDLHEIYNGFPQNKYIIKTPFCWRINKNLSQVKLLEDISLLKASSLGFINAAHASFADGWIIFYSPKGEMIVLIIQSKRIKTIKDQNTEVTAKLVVEELEKVFGAEVRNYNNLKLKGVQYIFMFITDKNSVATNTLILEDVYLIPKPKHKDFYGRYRELVRNLHDTEKPRKSKKPIEVEESITSNFDIDDFIKQFLKEKKDMKIHQRTEIKMKCDRCGTSIAKSRMSQHQSGSKCKSKEPKQEEEVEEIVDETDEEIDVRTESNKKKRKEQKERKINKKQKTEEESLVSRRKS